MKNTSFILEAFCTVVISAIPAVGISLYFGNINAIVHLYIPFIVLWVLYLSLQLFDSLRSNYFFLLLIKYFIPCCVIGLVVGLFEIWKIRSHPDRLHAAWAIFIFYNFIHGVVVGILLSVFSSIRHRLRFR